MHRLRLPWRLVWIAILACVAGSEVRAQQTQAPAAVTREFRATRATRPPEIDGRLNEEAWAEALVLSEFTQQDPDEGKPATERTEVRILYDYTALYGCAPLRPEPGQIDGASQPVTVRATPIGS